MTYSVDACSEPRVIAALHRQCFDAGWDAEAVAKILAMPGAFALAGCRDQEPAGFILCVASGEECEIISLGVIAQWRRCGLAGQLLDATLETAAKAGVGRAILEVGDDNPAARSFYQARGFSQVGRRRRYYKRSSGHYADALILERHIGGN